MSKIIQPNSPSNIRTNLDPNMDINKDMGIDINDVDPIQVMLALHKRIVLLQRESAELRVRMSNFEIEMEMLKNNQENLKKESKKDEEK